MPSLARVAAATSLLLLARPNAAQDSCPGEPEVLELLDMLVQTVNVQRTAQDGLMQRVDAICSTMGVDCRRGVSPYPLGSSVSVAVDPAYAATLGNDNAMADCFLTPQEIATDPDAAALAAQFIAETASQMGVDPSQVDITGISLDSDSVPGCAPGYGPGETDVQSRMITISLDDGFTGRLGNDMARADCMLTPAEIASDPTLARVARGFSGAACTILEMMGPNDLRASQDCAENTGVSVLSIKLVGCGESNTTPEVSVQVPEVFSNALAGTPAYDDCTITQDELSPTGHDFVNQVVQNEATLLGVSPDAVSLDAIYLDGDTQAGCGQNAGLSGGFGVDLDPDYLDSLADSTGALDDGTLTPDEIAADPDAQALADEFRAAVCASLGLVDCSQIDIDGIDVVGGRRQLESGETAVTTARPSWSFTNGDVMLKVKLNVV